MHEMAIAQGLINAVLAAARNNNAALVEKVEVTIGEMQLVVPEALETAFEAVSRGTPAEGARLVLLTERIRMHCRKCGVEFETGIQQFLCPRCGQAVGEVVAGNDIVLTSIECT